MGAMVLTMMGCKKGGEGEVSKDTTPKPTNAQTTEAPEETTAPEEQEKDLYEYVDKVYGYSFKMPMYSGGGYKDASFVRGSTVYDSLGFNTTERCIAVFRYLISQKDKIDISKINSVYDIHENVVGYAYLSIMRSLNSWQLASYDIEVAEKAETINGYEMLKFEGTLEKEYGFDKTQTIGVTGYYILAEGLPIVVMGMDCTGAVYGRDYGGELTLMDSIREDVEAMVQTFSTEQWTGRSFK